MSKLRLIDPCDCIDTERSTRELHHFMLFCLLTANKPAERSADKALTIASLSGNPWFSTSDIDFGAVYREYRTGQYRRLELASHCLVLRLQRDRLGLNETNPDWLKQVPGIGPKTSRMFYLFAVNPDAPLLILDAHILRYLGLHNVIDASKQTPPEPRYSQLELQALPYFKSEVEGDSMAEKNLNLWRKVARAEVL